LKGMCARCAERETCRNLCPAAERYACKDFVNLRERYHSRPVVSVNQSSSAWERIQDTTYTDLPEYSFLSDMENKLLHSYWFQGRSYAEIAKQYHMSLSAIKSRLTRVYAKLRDREALLYKG
jgi:DNA-binding NarL/FixJ family response regulator